MKHTIHLLILMIFTLAAHAQDTFSIVAVDTLTGEVGSAGASCLDNSAIAGGAIIISDVLPGRGAIHTQSYWQPTNQTNAHNQMEAGLSPQEIIDWLVTNDVQNNPAIRQYGIVDFDADGHARTAAFTGASCFDWKGHITGPNYSIQGNILLSNAIIDSMEARFLREEGTLADKLMAALQGANVVGADTRCAPEGVSSLSAFLRMARPGNDPDSLYLDLNVSETPFGVEPIDELQLLYDEWKMLVSLREKRNSQVLKLYPNPAGEMVHYQLTTSGANIDYIQLVDMQGQMLKMQLVRAFEGVIDLREIPAGIYLVHPFAAGQKMAPALLIRQ